MSYPAEWEVLGWYRLASVNVSDMSRLGSSHAVLDGPQRGIYRRIFGIEDFHSHFRWHAVKRYLDPTARRILEVGANSGLMTYEVAVRQPGSTIVASEFDESLLARARKVIGAAGLTNVELSQADLRELAVDRASFDQALVVDVLEHIDDHETAVLHLAEAIRPGGSLVISVPTPNYPIVFGRAFHKEIGHVRDGYWLEDLEALLEPAGFRIEQHHYYTGPVASRGCSLLYRRGLPPLLRVLVTPPLIAAGLLGERHVSRGRAASVALIARRL